MDTKNIIYNYWNSRSGDYSNGIIDEPGNERNEWKKKILRSMDGITGLDILDVGTGPGFLALICAELGNHVTAVDLSENMLEKARENAFKNSLDIDFRQADAEDLHFPDAGFDVVTSKCLLWTLPDPAAAIGEWKRVLRDGGMVIAIDGDWHDKSLLSRANRITSDLLRMMKGNRFPYLFRKYYTPIKNDLPLFSLKPELAVRYFNEAGFENVSVERMDGLCRSARKSGKLLDRLDYASPVYLIKARK